MKFNVRAIGKTGYLLVIIGFILPVFFQFNGFQIAHEHFLSPGNYKVIGILYYLLFASALAGLVIGVLLLIKKTIPVFIDWLIIITCALCYFLFISIGFWYFIGQFHLSYLNIGAFIILAGLFVVLIAEITSKLKSGEKGVVNNNYNQKNYSYGGDGILGFVARAFRSWMAFILWLTLIVCAIGGFVAFGLIFSGYRENFNVGYAILGLLAGSIFGLITVILGGGLIANFLNMVDNIERQNRLLSEFTGKTNSVTFKAQKKCKKCGKNCDVDYTGCPNCGATNDFE